MTDIVGRLRHQRPPKGGSLYGEAANEIELLRWQVAHLKASLDYALSCTDKEAGE